MWNIRTAALLVALLPAAGAAQTVEPMVTVLKSGLHSVPGGHYLMATVAATGSPTATSTVTIEFRDALNQRRAIATRTLLSTQPVRLRILIPPGTAFDQLRAIVRITPATSGDPSEAVVTLEDIDADSFTVVPKVVCAEPSGGGGAEGNCDGWRVTHLTLEQAANSPD